MKVYLTGLEYIFVRNVCISNEDIFKTGYTHLLHSEDINSHSHLFSISQRKYTPNVKA